VTSSPTDAAASMALHAPAQFERGLYVDRIEHILDGNVVGPVFLDDDPRPSKIVASRRAEFTWRKFDRTTGKTNQGVVMTKFDDAETGVLGAAINAQDAHGGSLS